MSEMNEYEKSLLKNSLLPPWKQGPLVEWSIASMNHYHVAGEQFLFVIMTKGESFIKEEGKDDQYLWNKLCHQAWNKED